MSSRLALIKKSVRQFQVHKKKKLTLPRVLRDWKRDPREGDCILVSQSRLRFIRLEKIMGFVPGHTRKMVLISELGINKMMTQENYLVLCKKAKIIRYAEESTH